MLQKRRGAVGEGHHLEARLQPLQTAPALGDRAQLLPGGQVGVGFSRGGREPVGTRDVAEGAAHRLQIAAVVQQHQAVLVLLDPLPVAQLLPERRGVYAAAPTQECLHRAGCRLPQRPSNVPNRSKAIARHPPRDSMSGHNYTTRLSNWRGSKPLPVFDFGRSRCHSSAIRICFRRSTAEEGECRSPADARPSQAPPCGPRPRHPSCSGSKVR